LALALVLVAVACKKKGETYTAATDTGTVAAPEAAPVAIHVTEIDVGKGLNADKTIKDKTDDFGVRDTIYVSVKPGGAATGAKKIAAKWTYQDGKTVNETSEEIAPTTTEAVHEFHIQKATAWPKGNYKVEILFDGVSAGTKDFSVK